MAGSRTDDKNLVGLEGGEDTLAPDGVAVGVLVGLSQSGEPLVAHPWNERPEPAVARTTVSLGPNDLGAEVARLFGEWSSRRVQVDVHEATELFYLHLIQTDVINTEVLQDFSARRAYQLASQ